MLDPTVLHWPLVFLHLLAFAYRLGGDFGVYVTGGYVARADLPLAERLRFLDALLRIDILPRTGIVLLPVVGLQLAVQRGALALPGRTRPPSGSSPRASAAVVAAPTSSG